MKAPTGNTPRGNGAHRLAGGNHPDYLLTAYLFESISEAGRREVEQHLAQCESCRRELEELQGTLGLLQDAIPETSGDSHRYSFDERRLQRVLAAKAEHGPISWILRPRRAVVLSAAAVIVLGIGAPLLFFALMTRGMDSAPSVASPEVASAPPGAEYDWESSAADGYDTDGRALRGSLRAKAAIKERRGGRQAGAGATYALNAPAPEAEGEPALAESPDDSSPLPPTVGPITSSPMPAGPQGGTAAGRKPAPAPGQPGEPTSTTVVLGTHARDTRAPAAGPGAANPRRGKSAGLKSGPSDADKRSGRWSRFDSGRADAGSEEPMEEDKSNRVQVRLGAASSTRSRGEKSLRRPRSELSMAVERLSDLQKELPVPDSRELNETLYRKLESAHERTEEIAAEERAGTASQTFEADRPEESAETVNGAVAEKFRSAFGGASIESDKDPGPMQGRGQAATPGFDAFADETVTAAGLEPALEDVTVLSGGGQGGAHALPGERQDWGLVSDHQDQGVETLELLFQNASGREVDRLVRGWSTAVTSDGDEYYYATKEGLESGESLAFGDSPAAGKAFLGGVGGIERRLRSYHYYSDLDPDLSLGAFRARRLSVPTPAVGDEGLGRDGFRERYGVNPFVDTLRDHFSTFGMDVDTASYTLIRNILRSGKLPDPTTARTEEWVNYFRGAHQADPDSVFSVFVEGGPSPFGKDLDLLKITVKAREIRPGERRPLVLTFAVDTSGSMATPVSTEAAKRGVQQGNLTAESRLALVRHALKTLVEALESHDRVALVAYSTHPYLVLPHTPARERSRIFGAIDSLEPTGATNVEAGVDLAYRIADEVFEPKATNRVVLCSDGVANLGARGPEEILQKVKVFAHRGIYLSCVGFGMGRYNDKLLETVADQGNGKYTYVDTPAEAEKLFGEDLSSTLDVLAKDAKIQVDFNSDVVSHYRLLGYENRDIRDQDFRNDKIDAGEVGPGSTVTVLYEIRRRANPQGDLGKIYLRYRDTASEKVEETNYPLRAGVLATELSETGERFRFIAAVAETAELLRESYWARDGSYGKVLELLRSLGGEFRSRGEVREFTEIVLRAQALTIQAMAQP